MIREFEDHDLEAVMKLWLEANIRAHDCIENGYWQSNFDALKEMMPKAKRRFCYFC